MKRLGIALLACVLCLFSMAGCGSEKQYQDGIYNVEFRDFDSYGYKDYMILTVQDGTITELIYDARNQDASLPDRTLNEKYQKDMSAVRDTYPKKYTADLVNQLLETQNIEKIDSIAGATWSSDSFQALFKAVEPQMEKGDTTQLVIDNVPEK